jgi:hypothetical protein
MIQGMSQTDWTMREILMTADQIQEIATMAGATIDSLQT